MKSKICYLLIIVMIFMCTSLCFGETIESEDNTPKYIETLLHMESFRNNSAGKLNAEASLTPMRTSSFDKVVITIKIQKESTSTVVYNKSFTTTYDKIRDRFFVSASYAPTAKGVYSMDATYKCYKSGKLIETIKGVTRAASY